MGKFQEITLELLLENEVLRKYLLKARIGPAKKGDGAFVGTYDIAPKEFRSFGIVLPRGGMIIPGADPVKLKEMVKEPERRREAEDLANRRAVEKDYLNQVKEIIAEAGLTDIEVVEEDGVDFHSIGATSWHKSFLVREGEKIFSLHSEEEPYRGLDDDGSYEPWRTEFTPLEEVKSFLEEEARLVGPRKMFADRIRRLIDISHNVGQQGPDETGWDRPRVELFLYDDYKKGRDWGFFGHRCQGISSAHRIYYRKKLYEITEEGISRLEYEIGEREEALEARRAMLKRLFEEKGRVFEELKEEKDCYAGKSLATGKAKYDEWTETRYFLGDTEVTEEERDWLKGLPKDN